MPSGKAVQSINVPSRVQAMKFGRDGRLALRCDRQIFLSDISKQAKLEPLDGVLRCDVSGKDGQSVLLEGASQSNASLSVSDDGRSVAATDGNDIAVWNLERGKPVPSIHAGSEVNCLAFSPDGSRLVAGTGRVLKIWDMRTGLELRSLGGHTGTINAVVFSSDGYRIITGSDDQTIRIYDVRPITTELQTESEACTLCEALAELASSEAELESRIDTYPGVPDAAGRSAKWRASLECGSRIPHEDSCEQPIRKNTPKGRSAQAAPERSISHQRGTGRRNQSCQQDRRESHPSERSKLEDCRPRRRQ